MHCSRLQAVNLLPSAPGAVAICLALALVPSAVQAAAPRVARLRCEYLVNPVGIDAPQPRLSWIIETDQRGWQQTAYQILVASSPAGLGKSRPICGTAVRWPATRPSMWRMRGDR